MEISGLKESLSKTVTYCDSCKAAIHLSDKGKSKQNDDRKKLEPPPLSAILDYGMDGSTKEYSFCDVLCLKNYLNDTYPNSKKKKKSKASESILDCEVILYNKW